MNETSGFTSNGNIMMENDLGSADECVCVGWNPAEGVVHRDAGEFTDVAAAIFDETRGRRDRAPAFLTIKTLKG
jgi:hypothetical protein